MTVDQLGHEVLEPVLADCRCRGCLVLGARDGGAGEQEQHECGEAEGARHGVTPAMIQPWMDW